MSQFPLKKQNIAIFLFRIYDIEKSKSSHVSYAIFEDTKTLIRSCKSWKDRQYNDRKGKKDRRVTISLHVLQPILNTTFGEYFLLVPGYVLYMVRLIRFLI
jgi:hypothetical protein